MRREHLKYLACPSCRTTLDLMDGRAEKGQGIQTGTLHCFSCGQRYEIIRGIPRFVPARNYADSFSLQWSQFPKLQYDSDSGTTVSRDRFFTTTQWPSRLSGEVILEVGSGAGRFTEQALSTKAFVVSLDYSMAVDVNYASHGHCENILIVQGDIYNMPFREGVFDRIFCFGVLQHTPDVEKAFHALPRHLKTGGKLAIDVYRKPEGFKKLFNSRYWVRPLTQKISPEKLFIYCRRYIKWMWHWAVVINKVPLLGRYINRLLLIADYNGVVSLDGAQLKELAVLDTFDMLSPAYDQPQSLKTVRQWFQKACLRDCEVAYGQNGVVGRGVKADA